MSLLTAKGGLWLIVGTDSGFEGLSTFYYARIAYTLKIVESPNSGLHFSGRVTGVWIRFARHSIFICCGETTRKVFLKFFFFAFGDFIFLRAQKNEAKKGRPCGGLAQRKSFLWYNIRRWPSKFSAKWTLGANRTHALCEMA